MPNIDNDDVLVSSPFEHDDLQMREKLSNMNVKNENFKYSKNVKVSEKELNLIVERLKSLYVKLWLSLRACVKTAFQLYTDVLEAGTFIQNTMDLLMKGKDDILLAGIMDLGLGIFDDPHLRNIKLIGDERLQVGEQIENILIIILFAFYWHLLFSLFFASKWSRLIKDYNIAI